jgi:hypothetical protein
VNGFKYDFKRPEILNKVLFLKCDNEKNIRRLEKSLMKLPFIKSEDDLATDRLEEILLKIESKRDVKLAYITRGGKDSYTGMIKTMSDGKWLETIYGITLNEVLAKTLFYLYFYLESKKGAGG